MESANVAAYWPVLVVVDDAKRRDMLAQRLELEGYVPVTARSRAEAMAILAPTDWRPLAVVLDLMRPVTEGWHFCAQLRAERRFAQLPVVVLSRIAYDYPECRPVALLPLPLDLEALLAVPERCKSQTAHESDGGR
jgi:CheY-like chemotaxis protein